MRQLGRIGWRMPLTALSFSAASLALAGVPPFAGFWSEEKILAQAVTTHVGLGVLMVVLIFLAGVYISRAGMAAFAAWPGAPTPAAHDPGALMSLSTLLLALAALGMGWVIAGHLEAMLEFAAGRDLGWGCRARVHTLMGGGPV